MEAAYNQLKTLSAFQDSRILILNPSGQPLIDTGKPYTAMAQSSLKDFDPAIMGSDNYITGTFHGYFKENIGCDKFGIQCLSHQGLTSNL